MTNNDGYFIQLNENKTTQNKTKQIKSNIMVLPILRI